MVLRELALFAGAGGGVLGGHLLGWKTVAACEIEEYPRAVLLRRQLDGILPKFPIWDDIRTFDGNPFKGRVDIITGGFPCQDISAAGKGAGIDGERSGLWSEMFRVVCEIRPRFIFVENSPMLTSRGLHRILGDLAKIGYYAEWLVLGADDIGAPHRRKRIWLLGYTADHGQPTAEERKSIIERSNGSKTGTEQACKSERSGAAGHKEEMADSNETRLQRANVREAEHGTENGLPAERSKIIWWDTDPADIPNTGKTQLHTSWKKQQSKGYRFSNILRENGEEERPVKSRLDRVVDGVAHRVDRLKAIGNGQVPGVAAIAFLILYNRMNKIYYDNNI